MSLPKGFLERYLGGLAADEDHKRYHSGELPLREGDLYVYEIEYKVREHHDYKNATVHAASEERAMELLQAKEQRPVRYPRVVSVAVKSTEHERVVRRYGGGR